MELIETTPTLARCPGCGGLCPDEDGPTHPYMESSPGCWAAFGVVLAREYENPSLMAVHDLSVDAFAVQHPGGRDVGRRRQAIQSVALHLCRLTLRLEHGLDRAEATRAMADLTRHKSRFVRLEPPVSMGPVTAIDVARVVGPPAHAAAVHVWARGALHAWRDHRATVNHWLSWTTRRTPARDVR